MHVLVLQVAVPGCQTLVLLEVRLEIVLNNEGNRMTRDCLHKHSENGILLMDAGDGDVFEWHAQKNTEELKYSLCQWNNSLSYPAFSLAGMTDITYP